jgi:hypothetical protein
MKIDLKTIPIYDFNVHLPIGKVNLDLRHLEDLSMDIDQISNAIDYYKSDLKSLYGINYMLFNQNITDGELFLEKMESLRKNISEKSTFTLLLDFRKTNIKEQMITAKKAGVKGIKFHSYIQKIEQKDFDIIVNLSSFAEDLGMFICIDASFGTIFLYKYDNLKLAARIAQEVKKTPIILLHSGGSRALEAMLIADMQDNIFLETSLSIPFYNGSTLWKDLAFCYKKLNCDRVLYATDFPYVSLNNSLEMHQKFFKEFDFNLDEINKITNLNAEKLLSSLTL